MATYNVTLGDLWTDTRSWPMAQRDVAIYLLTSEHRITEGLFKAPVPLVAYDLAGDHGADVWTPAVVADAMAGLVDRGWLAIDGVWVCITKALSVKHNRPASPSAIKGAVGRVAAAPRGGDAWRAFIAGAERWCPDLADVILGRQMVVPGKHDRGLILVPVDRPSDTGTTPPVTPPVTTPVTEGVTAPDKPLQTLGATTPVTAPATSSPSSSLSSSPSNSISASSLVAAICDAARASAYPRLAEQAGDGEVQRAISRQLLVAGPQAQAATALVCEWLARRGDRPLEAGLTSIVSAAVQRSAGQGDDATPVIAEGDPGAAVAWSRILGELRGQVDETTHDLWLAPLQGAGFNEGDLVVVGRRDLVAFARDRLAGRCSEIATTLGLANGVRFHVAELAGAAA